jgi:hypothetical protein
MSGLGQAIANRLYAERPPDRPAHRLAYLTTRQAEQVATAGPLTMPCPECGHDALWPFTRADIGGGTTYGPIQCANCDPQEIPA